MANTRSFFSQVHKPLACVKFPCQSHLGCLASNKVFTAQKSTKVLKPGCYKNLISIYYYIWDRNAQVPLHGP